MLSNKLIRVKLYRNRIEPLWVDPHDPYLQMVAGRLIELFQSAVGTTRAELEEELQMQFGNQPTQLIHAGLAKLLEDYSEFEMLADIPPEELRQRVFTRAAQLRSENRGTFDRQKIFQQLEQELALSSALLEQTLFADLRGEQKLVKVSEFTAEQLLNRYNIALVQALLLRCTHLSILIEGETPIRFRKLFQALKFHHLIVSIDKHRSESILMQIDGPMSLFSSTQKYGLQLGFFFPHVLHCRHFELTAKIRWGTKRLEKVLVLNSGLGLRSYLVDHGDYTPAEISAFAKAFALTSSDWELVSEVVFVVTGNQIWVPDFQLKHKPSGEIIYLEILGFWRKSVLETRLRQLKSGLKEPFILALSEQMYIDENLSENFSSSAHQGVYCFKRTPLPEKVIELANELLQKKSPHLLLANSSLISTATTDTINDPPDLFSATKPKRKKKSTKKTMIDPAIPLDGSPQAETDKEPPSKKK